MVNSRASSPAPVLAAAVIRLLAESPRSIDDLADALMAEGLRLGPDPVEQLEDLFDEVDELQLVPTLPVGERLFWPATLLAGTVLTHVLSDAEVEQDVVVAEPDLLPFQLALPADNTPVELTDGSTMRALMPAFDDALLAERGISPETGELLWVLEPGWFARHGLGPGATIAVEVVDGRPRISACDSGAFDPALADRARAAVHGLVAGIDLEAPHELDVLICAAVEGDASLFAAPVPPLGQLLETAGFHIQGDFLCPPGVDLGARRHELHLMGVVRRHGLEVEEAEAVVVLSNLVATIGRVLDALDDALGDAAEVAGSELPEAVNPILEAVAGSIASPADGRPGGPTLREALGHLALPEVAEATVEEVLGVSDVAAPALELVTELLEPMVARQARPAVRWLHAKALDRQGRALEAEQSLEAAYSLDPQWPPVLEDLARFASDRGDAERGVSLLRRAGVDSDDSLLVLLEGAVAPDRADLGRNDPCWCGSGKRYKACHRGREKLDLSKRTRWLYTKAWTHMVDGAGREELIAVAEEWAASGDAAALYRAVTSEVVVDLALFEGGMFEEFVASRGELLPADELLLAQQWLLVDRSVHEIEEVRRDDGFTARDLRTGERQEVVERLATQQLKVGDLVLARLVPDGRATVVFGGIVLIDLPRRDMLLALLDRDPDALELAEFLAAMNAPPIMVNADGGELVLCEATVQVNDVEGVTAWLEDRLGPAEDGGPAGGATWHEAVDSPTGRSIRATVVLEGRELTISSPSEDRFDALLDGLFGRFDELEVTEESRMPAADLVGAEPPAGASAMLDPRDADPEIAAFLREHVRNYEVQWLDESIPALGGVTPRQAAADPTRRGDLIRLLDSFPDDPDNPGAMSPVRLREDLGLT